MYLVEALKFNVPAFHEDRLTQIVAATFNESKLFQRVFLKFLGVPYRPGLVAKTQVANETAPSRPDLVIFDNDRMFILVESKVDARSDKDQLRRHAKLRAVHNFLIARDPVTNNRIDRNFRKISWFEFFGHLQRNQNSDLSPIDGFLIQKLLSFGKECKMLLPDRITKEDFESASVLFTQVRLLNSPSYSFERRNPFQSLDLISQFLERVLIKVKDDPLIGSQLRPFVRRLSVSTLFYQDVRTKISSQKSILQRRELRRKSDSVILDKEIRLRKAIGGFHYLYVRVLFVPYYRKSEVSGNNLAAMLRSKNAQIYYRCEIAAGLSDAKRTSSDLVVYDDQDDIEFGLFYSDAVKAWKKKLLRG